MSERLNKMIFEWLQRAFAILTCVVRREKAPLAEAKTSALSFTVFPVIGLFFGILAMFIARYSFPILPGFTAWFVPALWWFLSGGQQVRGVGAGGNACSISSPNGEG